MPETLTPSARRAEADAFKKTGPEEGSVDREGEAGESKVDAIQKEEAKKAETVGAFKSGFRNRMTDAIKEGADRAEYEKRMEVIDAAAKGNTDLKLDGMAPDTLGFANIDGGRGSIRLSKERFAGLRTSADAKQMVHAGAHENGHAESVALQGELIVKGEAQEHLHLYEGVAEITANAEVGMGTQEHREGQPEEVYAEGQRTIAFVQAQVGKELVDRVFKQTGDLSELQEALDRKGVGRAEEERLATAA